MNEAVTKRFLLYFRLMLLVWILIANAFFHVIEWIRNRLHYYVKPFMAS